MIKLQDY